MMWWERCNNRLILRRSVASILIVPATSMEWNRLVIWMHIASRESGIRIRIDILSLFRFLELIRGMPFHRTGAGLNVRGNEALYSLELVAIRIFEGPV